MDHSTISLIANYATTLSAVFSLIWLVISFLTLKQVQKININVIHDHSIKMEWDRISSNNHTQDNRGNGNRNAWGDYIENN